ncbi:MAG: hypothetical protein JNL12_18890 [Planctomycetes bacterium]|nr:hypothetical protein [Planctomycetota bacterium]
MAFALGQDKVEVATFVSQSPADNTYFRKRLNKQIRFDNSGNVHPTNPHVGRAYKATVSIVFAHIHDKARHDVALYRKQAICKWSFNINNPVYHIYDPMHDESFLLHSQITRNDSSNISTSYNPDPPRLYGIATDRAAIPEPVRSIASNYVAATSHAYHGPLRVSRTETRDDSDAI